MTKQRQRPIPYNQLEPQQRAFIDSLIDSYIAQIGKPPGCPDAVFKDTVIQLIEEGRFIFRKHDRPGLPPQWSLGPR